MLDDMRALQSMASPADVISWALDGIKLLGFLLGTDKFLLTQMDDRPILPCID